VSHVQLVQGDALASTLFGGKRVEPNYDGIPTAVFTWPELASVVRAHYYLWFMCSPTPGLTCIPLLSCIFSCPCRLRICLLKLSHVQQKYIANLVYCLWFPRSLAGVWWGSYRILQWFDCGPYVTCKARAIHF